MSWSQIFDHWPLVVLDLHEVFGADWGDPGTVRPWTWWREHAWGLLGTDCRLVRALRPAPTPSSSARTSR